MEKYFGVFAQVINGGSLCFAAQLAAIARSPSPAVLIAVRGAYLQKVATMMSRRLSHVLAFLDLQQCKKSMEHS